MTGPDVVFFDQRMSTAHLVCWPKSSFLYFLQIYPLFEAKRRNAGFCSPKKTPKRSLQTAPYLTANLFLKNEKGSSPFQSCVAFQHFLDLVLLCFAMCSML